MKKLFTSIMSCLLVAVLITSCGTRKSFTKSNYNKRYYVDMSKRDNAEKLPADASEKYIDENITAIDETSQTEDNRELEWVLNNSELITVNNNPVVEPIINEMESDITEKSKAGSKTQLQNKTVFNDANKTIKKNNENQGHYKINEIILDSNQKTIGEKVSHPEHVDSLSLFWIVLLIVLILWAFGFAFVVSGLVHLLLLVFLILLILWLLRII